MRVSGSETLLIDASPESCRAALLDLASYPDWYPGVREAAVLETGAREADALVAGERRRRGVLPDASQSGGTVTARLVFGTGLPVLAEIECVLRLEPLDADRLQPTAEGGALEIDGRGWTLEPQPDGRTRATYEIGVEMSVPGGFVTERLVRGKARHFLIEEPLAALKRRVERTA